MSLKSYTEHQEKNSTRKNFSQPTEASEISCTEKHCSGEMYYLVPYIIHPQYPDLKRAYCNHCGWRGWC